MIALSPALERLLAPQERLTFSAIWAVRHGGGLFADLAYANSYDGPLPEVLAALRNAIDGASRLACNIRPTAGPRFARRLGFGGSSLGAAARGKAVFFPKP